MNILSNNIGNNLARLRKQKGLNQDALSKRTGLSRSYISLIETGKKIPSVSSLSKIADSLGVRAGEIFENDAEFIEPKIIVNRKADLEFPIESENKMTEYLFKPLAKEKRNKIMNPFFIKALPNKKITKDFVHRGEEFNIILKGKIKYFLEGEEYIFEEGDCFYHDSSLSHNAEVVGNEPVYVISVTAVAATEE